MRLPQSRLLNSKLASNWSINNISRPATLHSLRMISSPPQLHAMSATVNTAELLEQILSYLPALQLLPAKATCRNFRNAIEASPVLRREMSTFMRLGDVDESDLFKTDAGGDVVYPVKGLDSLAFFYPADAERRLFVRVSTEMGRFERMRKAGGFAKLVVVDQSLSDVTVGWHCSCFAEGRAEVKLVCQSGMVTFGDILNAMEAEHRSHGHAECGSVVKFWLDGLWKRSKEMRELGC